LIDSPPSKFKYPLKTVVIAIQLVLVGLLSLRGVKRTFSILKPYLSCSIPSHEVIQNWIMRYGLYQLRKLPERRDDWIFILDHSIEFGKKQCLLILGVSKEKFLKNNCRLQHKDMTVLATDIIESATGQSVTDSLMKVAGKTGFPAQIVSDGGSNILNGCRDFIVQNNSVQPIRQTYDVTHKAALLLKHQLKNDTTWQSFCKKTAFSKQCLVHTELGYLAPPKPRDKARWQNLDMYIKWAEMILSQKNQHMSKTVADKFKDKLSWVAEYKSHIKEWRTMLDILYIVKHEVKVNGFSNKTTGIVKKEIDKLTIKSQRIQDVKFQVMSYIEKECTGIDGAILGCSDIIESIFGKYKNFSGKSPMKEIGRAVLTIPAFTSTIDYKQVKMAMEAISAKDVIEWQKKNIGTSLFAKRKEAFNLKKEKSR
jgi:hypothetical protein